MLPNMSQILDRFSQDIIIKSVVQTVVNHIPVNTETPIAGRGVIQLLPADAKELFVIQIDTTKSYYTLHTKATVNLNDIIQYKNKSFKVTKIMDFSDYGYSQLIIEELK